MLAAQHSIAQQSSAAKKLPFLGLLWQRRCQISAVTAMPAKPVTPQSEPDEHSRVCLLSDCCTAAQAVFEDCYKLLLAPCLSAS